MATWDPQFSDFDRDYHSVAVLQLDGRVLSAGSDGEDNAHIFEPPYLFNTDGSPATRPVIASSPATAGYGSDFTVRLGPEVPAANIAKVTLVRLAASRMGSTRTSAS